MLDRRENVLFASSSQARKPGSASGFLAPGGCVGPNDGKIGAEARARRALQTIAQRRPPQLSL
jgi:hypothetical protein